MPETVTSLTLDMLKGIQAQLSEQAVEIRALRETVIRLETHGYHEQIKEVRDENTRLRDKIIVLETQGRVFAAGISAGVSVLVSVVAGILLWGAKSFNG